MAARRGILFSLALCLLAATAAVASPPAARAVEPAKNFLVSLSETAMAQLSDAEAGEQQREERFRTLFRANFDIDAIGQFVVARYWRGASEEQRRRFIETFEDVLVQRFLPMFEEASGPSLEFGRESRDESIADLVIVNSVIRQDSGQTIRVDWRLSNRAGEYRILDIVAEGVSLAITYRQEYASVLARAGGNVDALTDLLEKLVAQGAFKPQ